MLQDYAQAHAWFNLAASQGHEKAALYRDEIAQKMTSNQVARAQQLAIQLQSETRTGETKRIDKNLIVSIQKHLHDLGYYSGAIDGLTGQNTSTQNEPQSLSWMRFADGEIKVMIGKDEVLNTKDNMFKAFDGISFINEGGNYAVDSIRVLGSHR